VVAVDDEIRVCEPDGHDWREAAVGERAFEQPQAVAAELVPGLEATREGTDTTVGPTTRSIGTSRMPT
jgi:hypothetical protein